MSRQGSSHARHSPSLHPFRFWRYPIRIDLPDSSRNRQFSFVRGRQFLAELAVILVDRLGDDVAGGLAGRASHKIASARPDSGREAELGQKMYGLAPAST